MFCYFSGYNSVTQRKRLGLQQLGESNNHNSNRFKHIHVNKAMSNPLLGSATSSPAVNGNGNERGNGNNKGSGSTSGNSFNDRTNAEKKPKKFPWKKKNSKKGRRGDVG